MWKSVRSPERFRLDLEELQVESFQIRQIEDDDVMLHTQLLERTCHHICQVEYRQATEGKTAYCCGG